MGCIRYFVVEYRCPDVEHQPRKTQEKCKQLQDVVFSIRTNLNIREAHKLEEFTTKFPDVFETKGGDSGCTDMCTLSTFSDWEDTISSSCLIMY